jgi:hypothetical protein
VNFNNYVSTQKFKTCFLTAECPPGVAPQSFHCRKQIWSINTQVVADEKHLIRDLDVRWAGCTHDSRVWKNSWYVMQNHCHVIVAYKFQRVMHMLCIIVAFGLTANCRQRPSETYFTLPLHCPAQLTKSWSDS